MTLISGMALSLFVDEVRFPSVDRKRQKLVPLNACFFSTASRSTI
jgi:hypothetical protein